MALPLASVTHSCSEQDLPQIGQRGEDCGLVSESTEREVYQTAQGIVSPNNALLFLWKPTPRPLPPDQDQRDRGKSEKTISIPVWFRARQCDRGEGRNTGHTKYHSCRNANSIFRASPTTARRKMRRSQMGLSRIARCPPMTAPKNIVTPRMTPSL